jgi:hypothetical protein
MRALSRLARAPALHFLLIGGALFALRPAHEARRDGSRGRIVLTADDVERLRREWAEQYGVPPGPAAEAVLLEDAIDEEILHREALALGLDRQQPVVRERLARLGSFLDEDAGRDGDTAEREARRLGLERSDVVIRRHLGQTMRLAAGRLGPAELPTESELEAYLARHAERFREPERVRLTHVYLSRERRGAALQADATRVLDALRRTGADPETAPSRGDAFIRGPHVAAAGDDLERIFGPGFPPAIAAAAEQTWVGPVPSSYGLHLVWIHRRVPARVPPLGAVRSQVLQALLKERSETRRRDRLRALRARYEIRVER